MKNKGLALSEAEGFSLIELVIICFIGMALILLLTGLVNRSRDFSRTITCVNNMKQIAQAIENYQADWKTTPDFLLQDPGDPTVNSPLCPMYVKTAALFRCPNDRQPDVKDSYSSFYLARTVSEDDGNKICLACNRHFGHTRTVSAYLSYAVDVGALQQVKLNSTPLDSRDFGRTTYTAGNTLTFKDNTTVTIEEGKAGVLSSFINNSGKIYSIIYVPDYGSAGDISKIHVTHTGDSQFEVVTPAVIAGVEGTDFYVTTEWKTDGTCETKVEMVANQPESSAVITTEVNTGTKTVVKRGQTKSVKLGRLIDRITDIIKKILPRRNKRIRW